MQDRPVAARDRAQLDVHHVVAEPPAVREPREVAVQDAEAVRVGGRRDRRVQPKLVGRARPREVEGRNARQQHRDEVVAPARRRRRQRGVQNVDQRCQLRVEVVPDELRVVLRILPVPVVLLAERDQGLVDQRVPQPRDLHERAYVALPAVRPQDPELRPVGTRVDADRGRAVDHMRDRNLQDDRVDVVTRRVVNARSVRQRNHVQRVERPEPAEVEDRAEVDEERVVTLAGEDLDPTGKRVHGSRREAVVVRRRPRADVVRR